MPSKNDSLLAFFTFGIYSNFIRKVEVVENGNSPFNFFDRLLHPTSFRIGSTLLFNFRTIDSKKAAWSCIEKCHFYHAIAVDPPMVLMFQLFSPGHKRSKSKKSR